MTMTLSDLRKLAEAARDAGTSEESIDAYADLYDAVDAELLVAMLDVIEAADAMRVYFGDSGECDAYDVARQRLGEME